MCGWGLLIATIIVLSNLAGVGIVYVLVVLQLAALALFTVVAIGKALDGDVPTATDFSWSWLSPFSVESFSAPATALSLSIFIS